MHDNPITIEALVAIDAIDRRKSYAKAAEELNKATSALSYVVQKLEEQLNITLFERQGRRSVLTAAGRVILEDGREILKATQQLADKAKQVATGWEPSLRIAIESTIDSTSFFQIMATFIEQYPSIEIDIQESVLSGAWDALEHGIVDLIIGAPGPVPLQKGFRAVPLVDSEMLPVISSKHPYARYAHDTVKITSLLPKIRRVVSHDTSTINIARSAGLSIGQQIFYVQNMDQKIQAQLAGIGIGHLPKKRIQTYLDSGEFLVLSLGKTNLNENFLAWKINNKGKALQALTQLIGKNN